MNPQSNFSSMGNRLLSTPRLIPLLLLVLLVWTTEMSMAIQDGLTLHRTLTALPLILGWFAYLAGVAFSRIPPDLIILIKTLGLSKKKFLWELSHASQGEFFEAIQKTSAMVVFLLTLTEIYSGFHHNQSLFHLYWHQGVNLFVGFTQYNLIQSLKEGLSPLCQEAE